MSLCGFYSRCATFLKGVKEKSVDKYRTSQLSHRSGACRVFPLPGEGGLSMCSYRDHVFNTAPFGGREHFEEAALAEERRLGHVSHFLFHFYHC